MGLSALDVHDLTVAEFFEAMDGARARTERGREQGALMVQWLLAPHCKRGRVPSVDEILGRDAGRRRVQSWEEIDAVLGGEEDAEAERRAHIERMRAARAGRSASE